MCEDERDRSIGFQFKRMDNIIVRHLRARLAAAGFDEVTVMHGWILGYIYSNRDRKVYQKDLEESFGIARSTATNILKLMERKGYLTRLTDDRDTRCKQLKLTLEGERVHIETIKIISGLHRDLEKGVTGEERETFFRIIGKMKDNIEGAVIADDGGKEEGQLDKDYTETR